MGTLLSPKYVRYIPTLNPKPYTRYLHGPKKAMIMGIPLGSMYRMYLHGPLGVEITRGSFGSPFNTAQGSCSQPREKNPKGPCSLRVCT